MDDEEEERGRNQESTFKYCAGNIQNTDVQIVFFFYLGISVGVVWDSGSKQN